MAKPPPGAVALQIRALREAKFERAQAAKKALAGAIAKAKPKKAPPTIFGYEPGDTFVYGEPMQMAHQRILSERAKAKPKA